MSRETAKWFLSCVGIACATLLVYLAFDTRLSLTYIFGVFIGIGIGASMILLQKRHEDLGTSTQKEQGWRWLLFAPVISATLSGLIRTLGTPEFQVFVLVTISSWLTVFLLWFMLRFLPSRPADDEPGYKSYINPKPEETWRAAKEKYDRQQAEWKERQHRK